MAASASLRRLLAFVVAVTVAGALVAIGRPAARLAWARMQPRTGATLAAVSADGTRMLFIEEPSRKVWLRDEAGEHLISSHFAVVASLGPGTVYVARQDLFGAPRSALFGMRPGCSFGLPDDAPWSRPVWRADGAALARRGPAGVVVEGPEGCGEPLPGATSAAFVGDKVAWTDGQRVWLDGALVWEGTQVHLMMAAGAAWLLASEGFAELSSEGVRMRETAYGLALPEEMPQGVCLVEGPDPMIQLKTPPSWGARCWRPGASTAWTFPRGVVPVDVDAGVDRTSRVLHELASQEERSLPAEFPIRSSTRRLPDGRLRTFSEGGYWELAPDGAVREVRWGPDETLRCVDCGEPTFRYPAELR